MDADNLVPAQPMLWRMYWLNYLDRNAIALARLNDLEEDLNLDSTRELHCETYSDGQRVRR